MNEGVDVLDEVFRFVDGDNMPVVAYDKAVYTDKAVIHQTFKVESGAGGIGAEVVLTEGVEFDEVIFGGYIKGQMNPYLMRVRHAEGVCLEELVIAIKLPVFVQELDGRDPGDFKMPDFSFFHIVSLKGVVCRLDVKDFYLSILDIVAVRGMVIEKEDLFLCGFRKKQLINFVEVWSAEIDVSEFAVVVNRCQFLFQFDSFVVVGTNLVYGLVQQDLVFC